MRLTINKVELICEKYFGKENVIQIYKWMTNHIGVSHWRIDVVNYPEMNYSTWTKNLDMLSEHELPSERKCR